AAAARDRRRVERQRRHRRATEGLLERSDIRPAAACEKDQDREGPGNGFHRHVPLAVFPGFSRAARESAAPRETSLGTHLITAGEDAVGSFLETLGASAETPCARRRSRI